VSLAAPTLARPDGLQPPRLQFDVEPAPVDEVDLEPTEDDLELVAEYEQMMAAQQMAEAHAPETTDEPVGYDVVDEHQTIAVPDHDEVVEAAAEPAMIEVEPAATDDTPDSGAPFRFDFDLNKVLAQVAAENDGLPVPSNDDVDEDVRAAVRAALAEIEAATRPPVTHGLSAAAFEIALGTAPDSAADIEPAAAPAPWLPSLDRPTAADESSIDPPETESSAESTEPATPTVDVPSTGLRRLIAPRKP
jgi:hypothetical protein